MSNQNLPQPINEPIYQYTPGSPERAALKAELNRQLSTRVEIPIIIGGREIRTGKTVNIVCPHDHQHILGCYHVADSALAVQAVESALAAKAQWEALPFEERAAVFLKAADKVSGEYRYVISAATMLGQSKNVYQAKIDSVCELIDFLRFNVFFMQQIYSQQPIANTPGTWSRLEYRPLEGFVFAIAPFNFTAISGNLSTAPAMLGNTVILKPASTAVLSAWYVMKVLKESGLPDGVINFLPGSGREIGNPVLDHPALAGVHFTGSTGTFNNIWKRTGDNLTSGVYRTYPKLVGETGGKDFVIAYPDADVDEVAVGLFRGAFEYQGQKCSAASRAYMPKSLWSNVLNSLKIMASEINMGDVADFETFMGAVIDRDSFDNIVSYIEFAKKANDAQIVVGGSYDASKGYFIQPTVIETVNPHFKSMEEEIFGPVLTVYVYEDSEYEATLDLLDRTSPYALTGAVFASDRRAIQLATQKLRHAAGNFYINDKPTGAVVGQQPFGGARMSGTNDKAGSLMNLMRWVSARTIKETFNPARQHGYPHMKREIEQRMTESVFS